MSSTKTQEEARPKTFLPSQTTRIIIQEAPYILKGKIEEETITDKNVSTASTPIDMLSSTMQNSLGSSIALIYVSGFAKDFETPWLPGERVEGTGTGWFIRLPCQKDSEPTKYILTCYHVIENASLEAPIKFRTRATNKEKIPARIVAIMPQVDAAILEVIDDAVLQRNTFKALSVGDSKQIRPGDKLFVFGYPLGMENFKVVQTMLNGMQNGEGQVDGAINPGHSGAPVMTEKGQTIGFIISGMRYSAQNVSFFQPIAYVKALWDLIVCNRSNIIGENCMMSRQNDKQTTKVKVILRGALGIEYQNSTNSYLTMIGARNPNSNGSDEDAQSNQIPSNKGLCGTGVIIQNISKLSPLMKEPLKAERHDVICSFTAPIDGEEIEFEVDNEGDVAVPWSSERLNMPEVLHMVKRTDPITFNVWKTLGKNLVSLKTTLPNLDVNGFKRVYSPFTPIEYVVFGGLVVQPLTANIRHAFPILQRCIQYNKIERPTLVIVKVLPNSAVSETGILKPGKILTKVNGRKVKTLDDYVDALKENSKTRVYLTLETKDNLVVTLPIIRVADEEKNLAKQNGYQVDQRLKSLVNMEVEE